MKHDLLTLVAMKLIWPRGPGPSQFNTELHLNHAIEEALDAHNRVPTPESESGLDLCLYMRKSEAAAHAGCGEQTIHRAIAGGQLQTVRRRSRVYVVRASLEAWLTPKQV
jgi:hypothetical protein